MIDVKKAGFLFDFSFQENQKVNDIKRCLSILYTTRSGEQPMDREFGLDFSFQDAPINVSKNMFVVEIIKKTEKYEKRVSVENVDFITDPKTGHVRPNIHFQKGAEW